MSPIRIVTLPSRDHDFAERVRTTVGALNGAADDVALLSEALRTQLAAAYPRLSVRQQSDLATLGVMPLTVYVYRDGLTAQAEE